MSEQTVAVRHNSLLQNSRFVFAGAALSTLALVGCSSGAEAPAQTVTRTVPEGITPSSPTPAPNNNVPNLKNIACHQIVPGDVMVECTNVPSGHYSLHLKSPNGTSIAHYYQQSAGANAELIPQGAYTPVCTKGFVTFLPVPKDGSGNEYTVYSFDVCGPATFVNS